MLISMKSFAERYRPCLAAREWAQQTCRSMREVWDCAPDRWLLWISTREGVLTGAEFRRFGCWAVRLLWDHLDGRSRSGITTMELHLDGLVGQLELQASQDASRLAARDSNCSVVSGAAASAAESAAHGRADESVWWVVEALPTAIERREILARMVAYLRDLGNPFS